MAVVVSKVDLQFSNKNFKYASDVGLITKQTLHEKLELTSKHGEKGSSRFNAWSKKLFLHHDLGLFSNHYPCNSE